MSNWERLDPTKDKDGRRVENERRLLDAEHISDDWVYNSTLLCFERTWYTKLRYEHRQFYEFLSSLEHPRKTFIGRGTYSETDWFESHTEQTPRIWWTFD